MTEYLFLFHSTPGVVRTRKALQVAGIAFQVKDIPRQLRGGCGLCISLRCLPGEGAAVGHSRRHGGDLSLRRRRVALYRTFPA
ncbi:Protein of uncharacterised function (DUF3343) [Raoultella terrigena]|uniref:Protein of uncharacterized function (DUF3343) n=1 Tax=Raoultella terrigena TaxID=577 RepID=A0A4U9DCK1_RAOTE|nr:Protein of uncharacterised function (DUF3343) [Raoultella terrigena]